VDAGNRAKGNTVNSYKKARRHRNVTDAVTFLARSSRTAWIGAGGGGDVVGAHGAASDNGNHAVIGGVAWERWVVDPEPGPCPGSKIHGARELGPGVLAASSETRVRASGVRFAEARMAELLGQETVLIDVTQRIGDIVKGLLEAVDQLGCDALVFVDVGGDMLARGNEIELTSPLCDAVMLAVAKRVQETDFPVMGAVFGPGCDGELNHQELSARLRELGAAGGYMGSQKITRAGGRALAAAVGAVPTEASAMALRCYRGERGLRFIRNGHRSVDLSARGAKTLLFDPCTAVETAARMARAIDEAGDVEIYEANEVLHGLGVKTELDLELLGEDG